jgi:hypothetical protein
MIATDQQRAAVRAPVRKPAPAVRRGILPICADLLGCALFLVASAAGALPLVWGLVLRQPPLAASGACFVVMGLVAVINRLFAPSWASRQPVPCLAALIARPWVLRACAGLGLSAFVILVVWWPR